MAVRLSWSSLPRPVTRWVDDILGSPVTHARSQINGFSSGSADRVETADGRRAFVKAVSTSRNAATAELHRREGEVMRMLPRGVPHPGLLGVFDDDEWVALVIDDVAGRHPAAASTDDVTAVLDALVLLPAATAVLTGLPRVSSELAGHFEGWQRLADDHGIADLGPEIGALQSRLLAASADAMAAVDGQWLVHLDCRADNALIDAAGSAWLVDWPWASIGCRWLDGLTYLLDVVVHDASVDVDSHLGHALFAEMAPEQADAVLCGLAGGWYDTARTPAPPDLPTLRAFQRAEADAAIRWLLRRWS